MTDDANAPVEQVSQPDMLRQFRERFNAVIEENKQLTEKIKGNEVVALKLQGAIEALAAVHAARRTAYGDIGAQLDMQYHDNVDGTTTWKDHVAKVKADHPKP